MDRKRIVAIGQDLVELDRFRLLYSLDDTETIDRVFSATEHSEARTLIDPVVGLASCYAAKEAVLKTIGGLEQGMELTDIEIGAVCAPQPSVRIHGSTLRVAELLGIRGFVLTISRTNRFVSALAIAQATRLD